MVIYFAFSIPIIVKKLKGDQDTLLGAFRIYFAEAVSEIIHIIYLLSTSIWKIKLTETSNLTEFFDSLIKSSCISYFIELFFKFPNSNQFHLCIFDILLKTFRIFQDDLLPDRQGSFNPSTTLVIMIFNSAKITSRIVDADELNNQPGSVRSSNAGHISLITQVINGFFLSCSARLDFKIDVDSRWLLYCAKDYVAYCSGGIPLGGKSVRIAVEKLAEKLQIKMGKFVNSVSVGRSYPQVLFVPSSVFTVQLVVRKRKREASDVGESERRVKSRR